MTKARSGNSYFLHVCVLGYRESGGVDVAGSSPGANFYWYMQMLDLAVCLLGSNQMALMSIGG
jgi:hypothetical protein